MIKGESSAELRDRVACLVEHFTLGYKGIDKLTEFIASECDESFRAGREDAVIEQTAIWEARMAEAAIENRQLGRIEGHQSAALYHPRLVSKDDIAGTGGPQPPPVDPEHEIRSAARREAFEALRGIMKEGDNHDRILACRAVLETNQW